jgi:hypothetical protein
MEMSFQLAQSVKVKVKQEQGNQWEGEKRKKMLTYQGKKKLEQRWMVYSDAGSQTPAGLPANCFQTTNVQDLV